MGVEVAFGLISDDTALFVATLDSIGIQFHGSRHENTAIAMADGYAAATGKLGVAVLGRGPAAANSMHAATYAQRSRSGVLMIFGDAALRPPAHSCGPDLKAFDAVGALRSAGLEPFVARDAHSARQVLAQAVSAAHAGAAALLLPTDVQRASVDLSATTPTLAPPPTIIRRPPRKTALAAASTLLAASKRPLIIAGWGAYEAGAREDLIALAEHLGAALSTTLKAKDLFQGHPMDCGLVGSYSHAGGRRLIEQADCILAFGAGLNGRTTSMGTAIPTEVPVIHVDSTRANIGRWLDADVAMVADAKLAAQALLESVPARRPEIKEFHGESYRSWLDSFTLDKDFTPQHTPRTVDARAAALALDNILPRNRNVVYDAGNFLQALPYLSVPDPRSIRQATDFASIGLGIGAALGYARGEPDATTVLVIGDGGLLMTLGELETVVREDIPLVVILMNDCAYGAEVHFLKLQNMPTAKTVFLDIDFAPIAEALGFQTATIRSMQDLEQAAPMLRNPEGPVLLDVKINGAIPVGWLFDDK
ncbi:hypothetical protein ASL20_14880 [Cupriavidus necator]|nr:hypothetical protein ASL20_14880 [Cupriavidus necator]